MAQDGSRNIPGRLEDFPTRSTSTRTTVPQDGARPQAGSSRSLVMRSTHVPRAGRASEQIHDCPGLVPRHLGTVQASEIPRDGTRVLLGSSRSVVSCSHKFPGLSATASSQPRASQHVGTPLRRAGLRQSGETVHESRWARPRSLASRCAQLPQAASTSERLRNSGRPMRRNVPAWSRPQRTREMARE